MQVHWFGRFAGFPDWQIGRTRLTAHMLAFFFVESSHCRCTLNGRRYQLKQGELFIIRGGDQFSFQHDPQQPTSILSACLALGQSSEPNTLFHRNLPRRNQWRSLDDYCGEFEKVMQVLATTGEVGSQLRSTAAVLQWLAYVLHELKAPFASDYDSPANRSAVDKVLQSQRWATERLGQTIMLADWADSVGVGAVYFGRIFKNETGKRPMQWLNERRLQLAARLLQLTSKSIYTVAEECGYDCPFYFSRTFKKEFGIPPSEFRKRGQSQ
ncbi:MAG: AraC family transcriptional regulator [Verrucomicrobiales bacterium]|nr:AraC family transcriptional regulator [Verrucomicrobiales bacterium]